MPTTPHAPTWTPLPTSVHSLVESTPNAILLETSRFDATNRRSYLFLNPTRLLTATTLDEIPALFANTEAAFADALHVAGYLSHECNGHFESSTARALEPNTLPLACLECGALTEGAISNLFIELPSNPESSGKLFTPPLSSGVLPGVLRRHLLEALPTHQKVSRSAFSPSPNSSPPTPSGAATPSAVSAKPPCASRTHPEHTRA